MLWRGWRAPVAGHVVEDGAHLVQHAVALGKVSPLLERYPRALVLSIAALDLLVDALLDFALQDAGARGLVVVGHLEDVRGIDPVVGAPAHDMVAVDIALIHGDLESVSATSHTDAVPQAALQPCRCRKQEAHYAHCCMLPSRFCHLALQAF